MLYINAYKNNSFNLYLQVNNNIFTKKKFRVLKVEKLKFSRFIVTLSTLGTLVTQ
jgi:hypothetical protein